MASYVKKPILEWSDLEILDALQDGTVSDIEIEDEEDDDLRCELSAFEETVKGLLDNDPADEMLDQDPTEDMPDDERVTEAILDEEIVTAEVQEREDLDEIVFTQKSDVKWRNVVEEIEEFEKYDVQPEFNAEVDFDTITPVQYFRRYFPDEFIAETAEKTNMYALQKGVRSYKFCDSNEILKLIGLHLMMGIIRFPRIRLYWDSLLGISAFSSAMSVNRFFQRRTNLHFIDNLAIPQGNTDKFIKVRPLINTVLSHCRKITMEREICVDEQMIPFKGKLCMKQYIRGKPSPWGLKNFVLCGQSGIVYNYMMYQGKSTEIAEQTQKLFGLGGGVVVSLIDQVKPGQKLYMDNFFTNYHLMQELKGRKISVIGTALQNRYGGIKTEMPDSTIKKKPRGHIEQRQSHEKIIFLKWLDNRVVNMVSNSIGKGVTKLVRRWCPKKKTFVEVPCPEAVWRYNKGKGGVDKIDFLIALYRTFIKSKKWTLRVFTHFVDLAVTNSWLEYIRDAGLNGVPPKDRLDLLHFRLYVANALIRAGPSAQRKRGRPSSENSSANSSPSGSPRSSRETTPIKDIRLDGFDHLPDVDDKHFASRCKNGQCSSKTHFFCTKCNVHLCVSKKNKCFKEYHSK